MKLSVFTIKNFKMKRILFLFLLSFCITRAGAQDTIVKRSGDTIIAKILEINPIEIKYKKINFLDGPTYVEQKSFIKMIAYQGGRKEFFEEKVIEQSQTIATPATDNPDYYGDNSNGTNRIGMWKDGRFRQKNTRLTEREAQNIFIQTKEKKLVELAINARDARKMQYIGFAAFPLGMAGLLLLASEPNSNQGTYTMGGVLCTALAIACPIVSGVYKNKRNEYNKAAVKLYNQRF